MNIYIGADHGGYEEKEALKPFIESKGFTVLDVGNTALEQEDDYPDFASKAAKNVQNDAQSRGILVCRTGTGMCMVANKYKGIRAVMAINKDIAKKAREDEDANVLCLAGDFMSLEDMKETIQTFLETVFTEEERHIRRIGKMEEIL